MRESDAYSSILADQAVVSMLMPWPCPSNFGPDDRYCLEELVGAGSNSLVYRATDLKMCSTGFEATVAIKIGRAGESTSTEALTARRVVHPHVVRVLDRGVEPGGCEYLVTEFVQGGDLQSTPIPWEPRKAAEFMTKLARAVHAAHSAGVVHCDLKPANVLITPEGDPKLADFGLSLSPLMDDDRAQGNIAYMSPEQFAHKEEGLTPPSDVYALGGILYSLLTGRLPNGETPEAVAQSHRAEARPTNPALAVDLDRICLKALARNRDDRYESAAALANDLDRWLTYQPLPWGKTHPLRRMWMWGRRRPYNAIAAVALAIVLAAAVCVGIVMMRSAERERQTKMQAQAESVRWTNQELDKIRGKMRVHILSIAHSITGRNGDMQDSMLPTLTWLQWIADSPVLSNDGETVLASRRIEALRKMVDAGETTGRERDVDVRLARYSLLYFLVLNSESAAAADVLARVKADWEGERPDDPISVSIAAIDTCMQAELLTTTPLVDRLATLNKLESQLHKRETVEPTRRLVARVALRLGKDPLPLHE